MVFFSLHVNLARGPRFLLTHVVSTITINTSQTGFYLEYFQVPCGQNQLD